MSPKQKKDDITPAKSSLTRRNFIKSLSVGGAGVVIAPLFSSSAWGSPARGGMNTAAGLTGRAALVNTTESPNAQLYGVDMHDVQWTEGFWAERFKMTKESLVPHVGDIYMDPEISHAFRNFEIAAGLKEGEHDGPSFHDGDFYKWLEGAASLYAITKDEALDQQMDEIIEVVAQAQRDDGYIYTPVLIHHRNGNTDAQPLQASFETYTMGHLLTAAVVHYRATGKKSLLNVAVNLTNFLYNVYKSDPHTLANNRLCPSHYMGVVEIYRTTRNPKFLELANGLIDIRPMVENGNDDNQDRIPFREQEEAVGHAVRGTYLYAAVADLYAETGDETLLEPLEKIWNDLVQRKLYVTGASGALYDGVSPDGVFYNPADVHQVHQAWGRPYQLPSLTAHNETCANIGNLLWAWRMFQIKPEAQFADIAELTLYNSILSGVSLDGKRFLYTNPLRVDDRYPKELRWGNEREEYISRSNCCPPNVVRTVAQVHNYAYSLSNEGLWINLYGGNELSTELKDGTKIHLDQQTEYPWDGTVQLNLKQVPNTEFSLFLRIPGWADKAELRLNGKTVDSQLVPGEYAEIRRRWSSGDQLILELPMRVRLIEANPLVEEARNQIAVKRGPVVYSMESVDFPEDKSIFDVSIPADIQFTTEPTRIAGNEVLSLTGTAQLTENSEWDGNLYREISNDLQPVQIKLIPYYAWGNRGESEMTVWLPLSRA